MGISFVVTYLVCCCELARGSKVSCFVFHLLLLLTVTDLHCYLCDNRVKFLLYCHHYQSSQLTKGCDLCHCLCIKTCDWRVHSLYIITCVYDNQLEMASFITLHLCIYCNQDDWPPLS